MVDFTMFLHWRRPAASTSSIIVDNRPCAIKSVAAHQHRGRRKTGYIEEAHRFASKFVNGGVTLELAGTGRDLSQRLHSGDAAAIARANPPHSGFRGLRSRGPERRALEPSERILAFAPQATHYEELAVTIAAILAC